MPEGDERGFMIVSPDGVDVMLQSRTRLAADLPALEWGQRSDASFIFIEVAGLDGLIATLGDTPIASPLRDTFYGSRELRLCTPGGHLVTLVQMGAAPT